MAAVEASQTGFHFEEGGCWGMAAALHDALSSAGVPVQIRASTSDFVHAWVRAANADWDYRGSFTAPLESVEVKDVVTLQALAGAYGVDEDQFESDRAMAGEIVKAALAMSAVTSTSLSTVALP